MKFAYCYKTSDGVRHEEMIEAPSRDAAFATLREKGIRPIKVVAKDGTKANGEVRGIRKRIVVICVVVAAIIAGGIAFWGGTHSVEAPVVVETPQGPVTYSQATPMERQRIYGDRSRLAAWPTNLFASAVETSLARFAEPGRPIPEGVGQLPAEAEFRACLKTPLRIASTDLTEHIDLKRIVTGMKREMSAYLAGGGTVDGYFTELVNRQKMEIAYREKAEKHLASLLSTQKPDLPKSYAYWLKANAQLKSMGIYEIALPEELRAYQMSMDIEE